MIFLCTHYCPLGRISNFLSFFLKGTLVEVSNTNLAMFLFGNYRLLLLLQQQVNNATNGIRKVALKQTKPVIEKETLIEHEPW